MVLLPADRPLREATILLKFLHVCPERVLAHDRFFRKMHSNGVFHTVDEDAAKSNVSNTADTV